MLFKRILVSTMLFLGLTGQLLASPEQQERHQFCVATAQTAYEIQVYKASGVLPKESFDKGLKTLLVELETAGLSKDEVEDVGYFLKDAYYNDTHPQKIYDTCMSKKRI